MDKDAFARSSAARAWQAARDANRRVEEILARLEQIEKKPPERRLQRCGYCGTWSNAPVCLNHLDLLGTAEVLDELLGVEVQEEIA